MKYPLQNENKVVAEMAERITYNKEESVTIRENIVVNDEE